MNKLGKIIYKFGHINNKLISLIIWLPVMFLLNRIKYLYDSYNYFMTQLPEDEFVEITGSIILMMFIVALMEIFFYYIKYKKIKICETGIISSIVSWKWQEIKYYEWLYKEKELTGLKIYVKKNIFITWTGNKTFKISRKEEPYVKLLIEKYMYDYNIDNKNK
jgi:hypothetical protein